MRLLMPCLLVTAAVAVAVEPLPLFRPPVRPDVPGVRAGGTVDAFIRARLQAKGLNLSPEADRATLLRRLSFDLTGLPPTLDELDAFQADRRPDAYERQVERLLASSAFGERWAQFWLDLVRFAESDGFNQDALRPDAHRYRDWVIRSLNADLPYRDFLAMQLAGDELAPGDPDGLVATGYLRLYPDEYNAANLEQRRQEILDDITDTTGLAVLGLTVGCARCHDHKFDPITQKEYYRLQSFFAAVLPRDAEVGPAPGRDAWDIATASIREEMARRIDAKRKAEAADGLARFTDELQGTYLTPAAKRTPLQAQIAYMVGKQVEQYKDKAPAKLKGDDKKQYDALKTKLDAFGPRPEAPVAMAMTDTGRDAPPHRRLIGGDWRKPAAEVKPGYPEALGGGSAEVVPPSGASTGRRTALAKWLTRDDHPLTARVLVNRVWQQLTGRGIVATTSDFGVQGTPPTHPELLDWLALDHVEHGWSVKHTVRRVVLSATYRQRAATTVPDADSDNNLLWAMRRRRLEGEAVRDAMLSLAGTINRRPFGPSAKPELPAELTRFGWAADKDEAERDRRSVYVLAKRNLRFPLFEAFDQPDLCTSSARRLSTTTAPQALTMMNGSLARTQAKAWAQRLRGLGEDPDVLLTAAYRMAWGRGPDAEEIALGRDFLVRHSLADFCHALLNTNGFLYLE